MLGLISTFSLLGILTIATLWRPAIGFAGVVCLFGIKQWGQSSTAYFSSNRMLVNYWIGSIVILGLMRMGGKLFEAPGIGTRVWSLVVALYAYGLFSIGWSADRDVALEQWVAWAPYVLTIALLAPLLISRPDDVSRMMLATAVAGGAICVLALLFGRWGYRGLIVYGLAHADVQNETNPLAIASLGGSVAIVGLGTLFSPGSWWRRVVSGVLVLLGIALILRSGTRGQLIFVAVAMLVGMPMASSRRNIKGILVIVTMAVLLAFAGWWIWQQFGVATARWTGERSVEDLQGRLNMAWIVIASAFSNPLSFLVGLGNSSSFAYFGIYPHIAALEIFAEEGLIGFSIYLAVLAITFGNVSALWSASVRQKNASQQHAVATLTMLFLFEWLVTFKQGALLSSIYAFAYAIAIDRMRLRMESQSSSQRVTSEQRGAPELPIVATQYPNLMQ